MNRNFSQTLAQVKSSPLYLGLIAFDYNTAITFDKFTRELLFSQKKVVLPEEIKIFCVNAISSHRLLMQLEESMQYKQSVDRSADRERLVSILKIKPSLSSSIAGLKSFLSSTPSQSPDRRLEKMRKIYRQYHKH